MLHIYSAFPGGHLTKKPARNMLRAGISEKVQYS
jgi:hypothetical protein